MIANGADESKLTDDTLDNTITTEITVSIPSMEKSEDEMYNDLSVEDKLKQRLANSGIATYAAGVQLDSQTNPQWVTGLSADMEYLTADMYAKIYGQDGKGGWLAEGKITPQQADMYWSYISSRGFNAWYTTNELDNDGFPTGKSYGDGPDFLMMKRKKQKAACFERLTSKLRSPQKCYKSCPQK